MQKNNVCTGSRAGNSKHSTSVAALGRRYAWREDSTTIPTLCKPGTFFGYVLPRHVLQQPPEEHLNLTFALPSVDVRGQQAEIRTRGRRRPLALETERPRHEKAFSQFWSRFHSASVGERPRGPEPGPSGH